MFLFFLIVSTSEHDVTERKTILAIIHVKYIG